MFRYLFFMILFLVQQSAFAEGGCFNDGELNKAVAKKLNIPCEKFPELIDLRYIYLSVSGDVVVNERDASRFAKLDDINFTTEYQQKPPIYSITFEGHINWPLMRNISISDVFKVIEISKAKFTLPVLEEWESQYFEEFFAAVRRGEFPKNLKSLKFITNEDITLTPSNIGLLTGLQRLTITGDDDAVEETVKITLVGEILLPQLSQLELSYALKSLDASRGTIITGSLESLETLYSQDFHRMVERKAINENTGSIHVNVSNGQKAELDFADIQFGRYLELNGVTSVSNLSFKGKDRLSISGPDNGEAKIVNFEFSAVNLTLNNVSFENQPKAIQFTKAGDLELTHVRTPEAWEVKESKLRSLDLTNANIRFSGNSDFSELYSLQLKNASVAGAVLPISTGKLQSLELSNSIATVDAFPNLKAYRIILTGNVTVLDQSKPLVLNQSLTFGVVDLPLVQKIAVEFADPQKLNSLYINASEKTSVELLKTENASKLPTWFKMVVRRKADALRYRKMLGIKSVVFTDDEFLTPAK